MANKAVSEKALTVLNYLKSIGEANVTAADIAEALGMEKKSVDGVVTSGLQRKGLTERVIKLTDAGKAYDHEAAQAEDAAAKSDAE